MKVFIIYASAGFGHKKIAESVNEAAISLYGQDNVSIIDVLDLTTPLFKKLYSRGYIFLVTKLGWLWAVLFFLADSRVLNANFRNHLKNVFCRGFLDFLKRTKPDVIISTHFLVNELVSYLKEKNEIHSKLISIVTDFGVHNFWLAKNIDIYVAASDKTKEIMISKSIKQEKIKVLGMPTRKQFLKPIEKSKIKEKLGIKNDLFTVMVLTGGIGIGPIYQIVKILEDKINVIVICGNNQKLHERLRKLNYKNLVVLGWIDYVEEVMGVSDIIITKPGGSTISECLIMGLPMIFFSIIPGQEKQNAQIISKYGLGFVLCRPEKIRDKIIYFHNNPVELAALKKRIISFRLSDSTSKILNLINE